MERLFDLFAHGYSGYAFFDGDGRFDRARGQILEDLTAKTEWKTEDLADLLRRRLGFIRDGHIEIGGRKYAGHHDFWFDTTLEVRKVGDEFQFDRGGVPSVLTAIAKEAPEARLFPSLAGNGEPLFRIGVLSPLDPGPLQRQPHGGGGTRKFTLALRRSDHRLYSRDIFREDRIGGIPVLRIRSFLEHHSDDIEDFLDAADRYREAPCVVVDLRGNGGGSEAFVIEWIRRLTGKRSNSAFFTCELKSRTTQMGRANAMAHWRDRYPGTGFYAREAARFLEAAKNLTTPRWVGPFGPDTARIPNDTTVVIITNAHVASAAEGLVMRARHAENVVVVGENTRGALTFGNVSAHQLPHSGMMVWLPINFGLFPDLKFREEVGLSPDYWVPARDAVNSAVAALRSGTIETARPLPKEWLATEFIPEDPYHLETVRTRRRRLILAVAPLGAALLVWFMRRKHAVLTRLGVAHVGVGAIWTYAGLVKGPLAKDLGPGLMAFGGVMVLGGAALWARARRRPQREEDRARTGD